MFNYFAFLIFVCFFVAIFDLFHDVVAIYFVLFCEIKYVRIDIAMCDLVHDEAILHCLC